MELVTMSGAVMMLCRRSSSPRIGSDPTLRSRICWAACCSVSCSPMHVAPVCMMSRAVVITYPLDPGGERPCPRCLIVACSWARPPGRPQDPRQHLDCLGNASTCTSSRPMHRSTRRELPPRPADPFMTRDAAQHARALHIDDQAGADHGAERLPGNGDYGNATSR